MKGTHTISVANRDAKYRFELKRNITFVRGDSGTGKTTLFNMISDFTRLGNASGVSISCDKKCVALVDIEWKNQLENTQNSIVFIDEGFEAVASDEFARTIRASDNYYVIFNRESLPNLPYSVEEIYEIRSSGREHKLVPKYKHNSKHVFYPEKRIKAENCNLVLTEDYKSGYYFFEKYCSKNELKCVSAKSKTSIFKWLKEHINENVLVIADGAAFGSEIDKIIQLEQVRNGQFVICLPESFEWLILKSGIIPQDRNKTLNMLDNPSEYVDSASFFSWEQFFLSYLIELTNNTVFKYSKNKINDVYTNDENIQKIISELPME